MIDIFPNIYTRIETKNYTGSRVYDLFATNRAKMMSHFVGKRESTDREQESEAGKVFVL